MNVTIGLRDSSRELRLDLDLEEKDLLRKISNALVDGSPIDLVDSEGSKYLIAAPAVTFVQIAADRQRHVGFSL
ncbi:MAG: DUF3107 domain-containing protein [Actinomycetaceae bacterium]|nr:DUF3107 domain-containing protein [Actinomycetaceae bacterium]